MEGRFIMGAQNGFMLIVLVVLAFVFFVMYYIFKSLQFVIQAVNLYKDMITRQDVIIRLLTSIKEGISKPDTSGTAIEKGTIESDDKSVFCTNCGTKVSHSATQCPNCQKVLDS